MTRLSLCALALLITLPAVAHVRPARPNEDSHVSIQIPHAGGSGCTVTTRVMRTPGRGRTVLNVSAKVTGRCRRMIAAGVKWHALGKLKAGRYVVQTTTGRRRSFMVLPRAPKPDPVKGPSLLHVRRAIINKYDPGICVGTPAGPTDKAIAAVKRKHKKLWAAAKRFWPRSEDIQLYRRVLQLRAVKLKWVKRAEYRYSFKDGRCCSVERYEGTVTIAPTIRVGPRRKVGVKNHDC